MSLASQTYWLRKVAKKVGSFFKSCAWCGSTEVWKAHEPNTLITDWKHWCVTCGAKDEQCW